MLFLADEKCFHFTTVVLGLNEYFYVTKWLFENKVTKEENKQFLLLPQCFPLLVIGYPFNYRDFLLFDKIRSKSSAAELSYVGKSLYNYMLKTWWIMVDVWFVVCWLQNTAQMF